MKFERVSVSILAVKEVVNVVLDDDFFSSKAYAPLGDLVNLKALVYETPPAFFRVATTFFAMIT